MNTRPRSARTRGFALVEALASMLVLGAGMLGMAGFGVNLSRNADLAKQRSEATRLAQDQMERLRTFEQLVVQGGKLAYQDRVNGSDTPVATNQSNTVFTRNWALGGTATDDRRLVTVSVAWRDRADNLQSVVLNSMIAAANPADIGRVALSTAWPSGYYKPMNRSAAIPTTASSISGTGKSTLAWPGSSGGYLLFSDSTGQLLAKCTQEPKVSNTTATANPSTCANTVYLLLTGFIRGKDLPNSSGEPVVIIDQTQDIVSYECFTGDTVTNLTKDDKTEEIKKFRTYSCLIKPDTTNTPPRWSGRVRLRGELNSPPLKGDPDRLKTGTRVCRYTVDYNNNGRIDPDAPKEHPQRYVGVTATLDNQNFALINENGDKDVCPTGSESHQVISPANGGTGSTPS